MKKLIYCIVLLLLCPFTVFAQQLEWIDLSKNPPTIELDYKAQLFSIHVEGQYRACGSFRQCSVLVSESYH